MVRRIRHAAYVAAAVASALVFDFMNTGFVSAIWSALK